MESSSVVICCLNMTFQKHFVSNMRLILLIVLVLIIVDVMPSNEAKDEERPAVIQNTPAEPGYAARDKTDVKSPNTLKKKFRKPKLSTSAPEKRNLGHIGLTNIDNKTLDQTEKTERRKESPTPNRDDNVPKKGFVGKTDITGVKDGKDDTGKDETSGKFDQMSKSDVSEKKSPPLAEKEKSKVDEDKQEVQLEKKPILGREKKDETSGKFDQMSKSDVSDKSQDKSQTLGKVDRSGDETSSSSSFVTYFIVAAVAVIIIYLVFHNKKKLMAYIIEGRNTGRARRNRAPSGTEYKPLKNPEDVIECRPESA